jgi:ribulose-5-phosphate 4-epimerase/fuculose-1-phosphate aldolase
LVAWLALLPLSGRSLRERVSAEEWSTRVDLAACYRLVALYGMTDLVYNHITARVPGAEQHVLINPYGMLYEEITASSLIKIDLEGKDRPAARSRLLVNAAGYVIHSAVHGARHDAECVIHTHTRAGTAVSALAEGLMPLSQTAMRFAGHVAYHEYEGPAFNRGERERLIADLAAQERDDPSQPRSARVRAVHSAGFQSDLLAGASVQDPNRHSVVQSAAACPDDGRRGGNVRGAFGDGDHPRQ